MSINFEDEDEYPEGKDVFEKQMKDINSKATTIGPDVSMSVTLPERTRAMSIQRATPPNRSLSPMDIDPGLQSMQGKSSLHDKTLLPPVDHERRYVRSVDEAISPTITATRASRTSAIAVPSKRPTYKHDPRGQSSLPSSPSTLPQPAKRFQMDPRVREDFGCSLDPFFIAYDASVQPLLDAGDLAWGTIYEIARGVTKNWWAWSSVTREKLEQLRGTNAHAAHRVAAVMLGRVVPRAPAEEVWAEYDREQDAIMENKGRGLGGMGVWKGKDNWYGGRIQQVGRLHLDTNGTQCSIQLEQPEIRRSHRFSRFLGSRRILQVRVKNLHVDGNRIRSLFSSSKFILCGRVYLPFHAKEGSVYLVETNQDHGRTASFNDGDQFRISLRDFIMWHNPLGSNDQQPISKWSTRWALGLSTSIPTIKLEWQHIYQVDDIYVTPQDWEGKAPAEKVLTDGCGFINGAALTQIMRIMGYPHRPTAVQGRIGGSKGMWVLHPDPLEQVPDGPAKIWIRPSQTKIKLEDISGLGPSQLTLDLLAISRVFGPSHLSSQTLINLSHNGIDHQLLKNLMSLGMREEIQPFIDWTHPYSMIMVWKAVEKAGRVIVGRLRKQFAGEARALGLGQLRPMDNLDPDDIDGLELKQGEQEDNSNISDSQSFSSDVPKSSSKPTLHEIVLELIQAGFHPLQLDFLFKKLDTVISLILDDYLEKFHIPIMESCEAYIIPDPYGVLKEGEIHFRPSEPFVSPSTGERLTIILGDVLVSRNPTRLPSDVQKVKAVAHPKLSGYFDVILFPIKGKQSLASFLGGGDYDGDTVMLNWHRPLVEQFKGSPLCTAPPNLSDFFEREVEHVRKFDKRVSSSKVQPRQAQQALQEVLLLGLAETRVGLYSTFHDSAVYEFGYGSSTAIHLAYMFTTCLDASKTGLRVKEHIFEQDRQNWVSKTPWYTWKLKQTKQKGSDGPSEPQPPPRKHKAPPFILDVLVEEGEKLKREVLQQYRTLQIQVAEEDQDLTKPWYAARAKATQAGTRGFSGFKDNMDVINNHVETARKRYQRVGAVFKNREAQRKEYENISNFFAEAPAFGDVVFFSDDEVQILKASCASTKSLNFAFSVALHDLCAIKSRVVGNAPMAHQFAQCMTIPNVVTRTLSQVYGADT